MSIIDAKIRFDKEKQLYELCLTKNSYYIYSYEDKRYFNNIEDAKNYLLRQIFPDLIDESIHEEKINKLRQKALLNKAFEGAIAEYTPMEDIPEMPPVLPTSLLIKGYEEGEFSESDYDSDDSVEPFSL